MADTKNTLGHALLQAFGLDDQRVKRLSLNIEAGDVPLLTVTVYPRDVSAQQIEAIATEYEIISRSELRDIRERLAAAQQAEPVKPEYGSTDCVTFAGLPMTDGDRRLAAMLTQAFGADHPAIHDLVALLFAARGKQQAEPVQQAEPDHETRAELAEQQVVQLAEERDHYRNLWQKAQQAEPVQRTPATGAASCVPSPSFQMNAQGKPVQPIDEALDGR